MSNKKTKWTEENEVFLLKLISDNVNLEKISKKVKKTESEIIHKLKKVASKMLSENKSKDDIIKLLKFLTDEQVTKIAERHIKKTIKKEIEDNNNSTDLSALGLKNTKTNKNIKDTKTNKIVVIEDGEMQKIYAILTEINQKLDALTTIHKSNIANNVSVVDDVTTVIDESVKIKSQKKANNDESSSFITSGGDTDEIMNLIQHKTNEENVKKQKYINMAKKI